MQVEIKIFAAVRDVAGRDSVSLELSDSATVADVREALCATFPQAAGLLKSAAFAVDQMYATDATPVASDREIACIPPVSGG